MYELQYHQTFVPYFDNKKEAKELFFAYIEEALGPFKPCHAMEIHSYRKDIFDGNSSCPRVVVKDEDKREEVTRLVNATETNLVCNYQLSLVRHANLLTIGQYAVLVIHT